MTRGIYHFLDVGATRYGECTLVRFGDLAVLIDGSHEGDFEPKAGHASIPEQLAEIFGHAPPFTITLLVVTHCHADHIGCLPRLVKEAVINPSWALITDHKLGFGRGEFDGDAPDRVTERTRALAAALREEDASDMTDQELQDFIDVAANIEDKYAEMVKDLRNKGVKVIEYRGRPLPSQLVALLAPTGMKLLGPTDDQLLLAAAQIAGTNQDAADAVDAAVRADQDLSDVQLYRRLVQLDKFDDFRNPRGAGMNCQSITLAFGPPGERVLLAGDMQFTEPNVSGADQIVADLRSKVSQDGPYRLFKTTHHTSHNGQDQDFLKQLGNPELIVHSGGRNDATHPDPGTLTMLKRRSRSLPTMFARTDRNGRITVQPHKQGADAIDVARGRLNNFTSNADDQAEAEPEERSSSEETRSVTVQPRGQGGAAQVIIVNLPDHPVNLSVAGVAIIARPATSTSQAMMTPPERRLPSVPDTPPLPPRPQPRSSLSVRLAAGRTLPKLLFVTHSERLAANIGRQEAAAAIAAINDARQPLCDLSRVTGDGANKVRELLQGDDKLVGVVIAGGYDVVPAPIVDVLPPKLREALKANADRDPDRFIVWCDESYGDLDGDHVAERPVSRIPDARDADLFLTALQPKDLRPAQRFGIRNILRPFADRVWNSVAGNGPLQISEAFLSSWTTVAQTSSACQYFMLHGSDADATRFTGETEDGSGYTQAFLRDKVPEKFDGVVFSGCCWGALSVSEKAMNAKPLRVPSPRVAERSIALSYLKAGANAFVGCTGAHYSGPDLDPQDNYASALHEMFWLQLPRLSYSASMALFAARRFYAESIAADHRDPSDIARRLKNRAQFTCLGLGW